MKKAFLILGAVLLAFTALVGISLGANEALEKTKTSTHVVKQPVRAIVIDVDVGDVRLVRGGSSVEVRETVEYALNKPTVERSVQDGVLTIKSECDGVWLFDCGTDLRVEVPAGVVLQVQTDVGNVKTVGLDSRDVRVKTDVGDVDLDLTGDVDHVEARTDVGDIDVAVPDAAYSIDTSTDVGDEDVRGVVQDDRAARTIVAGTDVGDVDIHGR